MYGQSTVNGLLFEELHDYLPFYCKRWGHIYVMEAFRNFVSLCRKTRQQLEDDNRRYIRMQIKTFVVTLML